MPKSGAEGQQRKEQLLPEGAGSGHSIGEPVRHSGVWIGLTLSGVAAGANPDKLTRHCDGQRTSKTDPHGNRVQLARPVGKLKVTDTAREEFRSRVLRGVGDGEKHDRPRSCAASIARTVFGLTRQIDPYPAAHLAREQTWRERYRGIETDGLGVGFEQIQGQLAR